MYLKLKMNNRHVDKCKACLLLDACWQLAPAVYGQIAIEVSLEIPEY